MNAQVYPIDFLFSFFFSGVLVPGGFGVRGTEGKIQAISWARKQKKPFLGEKICLNVIYFNFFCTEKVVAEL